MGNKKVILSLEEFNELIKKLEQYRLANEKMVGEIKEYNKLFTKVKDAN